MKRILLPSLVVALALAAAGCDELLSALPGGAAELAPDVSVGALELRHSPALDDLGAYYCPRVIDDFILSQACTIAFGPPPPKSALAFEFGVVINMLNPNDIPVPALDVLVGLTLFEGRDAESLGAICVSLCGQDDPTCDGTAREGACQATAGDISSVGDFIGQIPRLISDLASGQAAADLQNSTILAGGAISTDLQFVLGLDQALGVFEKTALPWVQSQATGGSASLSVPVATEGTVFFRLPVLGKLGVDFGPFKSAWQVF